MERHKAMAIPVYFIQGEPHFLIVHDKRFSEWTFVTGGCRKREVYNPLRCALRELEEETRGVVNITHGSYSYYKFSVKDSYDDILNVYHVYVIDFPMSLTDQEKIINQFMANKELMDSNKIRFQKHYDENDFIEFDTINGIKHRKKIWPMIQEWVLNNVDFHDALYSHSKTKFTIKN
jgi:8-oxo-dGTP pyrophosphatase MutT (NUDIX family)